LQKDVAKEFGIGRTQMTNIEMGKTIPAYLLEWLGEMHNVSLDWLFFGIGDMFLKRAKYHVDVKKMLDDFEEHPELMHRTLSEFLIIKPFYIRPKKEGAALEKRRTEQGKRGKREKNG
jgi:hypothetical protein